MTKTERIWRNYIEPELGDPLVSAITPAMVSRMITALRKRPSRAGGRLSDNTVLGAYRTLRLVLNYAERVGYVASSPMKRVKSPTVREQKEMPITTMDQVLGLFRAARDHDYSAALMLGLGMGLRFGEARGLRWRDVDFEGGRLHVRNGVQVRDGVVTFGPLKTESSRRTLPIPGFVAEALRAERRKQVELQLRSAAWIDHDLVLTRRHGFPISDAIVGHALNEVCEIAGIPRLRFHWLRHLNITMLVAAGVPPRVVQEIAGHASYETTAKIYAHVFDEALASGFASLEAQFDLMEKGASGS